MKIATYNVRNLYDPGTFVSLDDTAGVSEAFFNKRIAHFTELFRRLDLDMICLQEIGGEKGVTLIGDALGYNYFFAKPNKRGIRMAVMYKKELEGTLTCESVSFGELAIPSIKERGDTDTLAPLAQRRDVLVIDMEQFHGKKLRVVVFHLKSLLPEYLEGDDVEHDQKAFTDARFRSIFYKMMELRGLRAFADKSLDEGREIIFLGDFNEHNKGSGVAILASSNQEERILSDLLASQEGDTTTIFYRGTRLTFDTILVSQQIKALVENVEIHNKDLQDYSLLPPETEVTESDHAMVVVTLK
jgi:exonuclease III